MKPRFGIIGMVLALVMAVIPSTAALAAAPESFNAFGTISPNISFGNPAALGDSGRWLVPERSVSGTLNSGSITGDFTMVYAANVDTYQAGSIHGTITASDYTIRVNGTSNALEFVPVEIFPGYSVNLPMISVSGNWNFASGAKGNGTLQAVIVFIPYVDPVTGQMDGASSCASGLD